MEEAEKIVNDYFKEHKLFSETYKIACKEILARYKVKALEEAEKSLMSDEEINESVADYIESYGYKMHPLSLAGECLVDYQIEGLMEGQRSKTQEVINRLKE